MKFKIGDRVLYKNRCKYEHTSWLIPGQSTGIITYFVDEDVQGYRVHWDFDSIDETELDYEGQEEDWYVSTESIFNLGFVGPIHKWDPIIKKIKLMQERRELNGYSF